MAQDKTAITISWEIVNGLSLRHTDKIYLANKIQDAMESYASQQVAAANAKVEKLKDEVTETIEFWKRTDKQADTLRGKVEKLREVLSLAITSIDSDVYPSCWSVVQQALADSEEAR